MAQIIDGKAMALDVADKVASDVTLFVAETGIRPTLAVVLVGEDPASRVYMSRKLAACRKTGIRSIEHHLDRAILAQDGQSMLIDDCAADELGPAAAFTPVPGGVGPMTVACLPGNTMRAARALCREE